MGASEAEATSPKQGSLGETWALLGVRNVRLFLVVRLFFMLAVQMQSVAIGWLIYERTHSALSLGMIGLAQFVPAALFSFVGGVVADRYDRKRLLAGMLFIVATFSFVLFLVAGLRNVPVYAIYTVLFCLGICRSFSGPASQALVPNLAPKALFSRLLATTSVVMNAAVLSGPSLGGILLGLFGKLPFFEAAGDVERGARGVFLLAFVLLLLSAMAASAIESTQLAQSVADDRKQAPKGRATFFAGLKYVSQNKALLGSISLDLVAVLLGGVVALLPIYAKDILHAGPLHLGLLRSATGAGALVSGLVLAVVPIRRHAGYLMFASVFAFGVFTIAFALSTSVWLSIALLAALGIVDMVSVVVRSTLVQLETPDAMRGRVSAVSMVFIMASNELGEFESGLTAHWFGPVRAAVLGGIGTCIVVVLWMILFPALRKFDRMEATSKA